MFLVTIFRIESELRIQDVVSQEIDKRVLKSFDSLDLAVGYLTAIKNTNMMYNFPFAMIQHMEKSSNWQVLDQKLYLLDEVNMRYDPFSDLSMLTRSTRRKLHNFTETVELVMS